MAESCSYAPNQPLGDSDLHRILTEARQRWLRPGEICKILRNHHEFVLNSGPPVMPPDGSLFLFDRKVIRCFRRDGYRWRKKKDGKTVKESHEKLKANSVDVVHCYYAHGEDNENFQRRCYWMLDESLEDIVLLHYREVKEGYKSGLSRVIADPGSQATSPQSNPVPCSVQANSPTDTVQASHASGNLKLLRNPPELCIARPGYGQSSELGTGVEFTSLGNKDGVHDQTFLIDHPTGADLITHKLTDARLDAADGSVHCVVTSPEVVQVSHDPGFSSDQSLFHSFSYPPLEVNSTGLVENKCENSGPTNDQAVELKKLDSFGRWMDKEIGQDCDDSLMASDSGNYWNTLHPENEDNKVSSVPEDKQLHNDLLGPSLSIEQLFSILDFSPDWAYSRDTTEDTTKDSTKVLIVGNFLVTKEISRRITWGCMFGEIEVSAEVLTDNVIRCHTPPHASGHVPFYVTRRDRLACSEVREFEYREKPSGIARPMAVQSIQHAEVFFQMRLAKLLNLGRIKKRFDCSIQDCKKCQLMSTICSRSISGNEEIEETHMAFNSDRISPRDCLIQSLLKERLCEWLICKVHEEGKEPHVLDDTGQGVIHLVAALGYEWAMHPIVAVGVSPNFRDARGRTGLHWASYFGREETVIALLRLGAAPGAVEDPTPACPGGKTAADLASSRGHKGIAGYLAEADLTSHISLLTVDENIMGSVAATIAAEDAIETAAQVNENLSRKGPLAAIKNSAYAASIIKADFRVLSFKQRQLTESSNDNPEVALDLVALGSLNKLRMGHFEDYLHSAAIKIQQRYRGWKRRKEFLKIRSRIVKIQAHVRGHQVQKNYKRVIWSVGMVEKIILRWRRKRTGLRGFQLEKAVGDVAPETEKPDEYEFLRDGRKQKRDGVDKALARVLSMAHSREACDQYMRLVTMFNNLEIAGDEEALAMPEEEISQKTTEGDLPAFSKELHL